MLPQKKKKEQLSTLELSFRNCQKKEKKKIHAKFPRAFFSLLGQGLD